MSFRIVRNDITKMRADAIVNTANPEPLIGAGTDRAVYEAAGKEGLFAARRKIGRIGVGEVAVTSAFGLKAKHIIHTVGPVWQGGFSGEERLLYSCYEKSLEAARALGCASIAFPLISAGNCSFPKDRALEIAVSACRDFLRKADMEICLAVFDGEAFFLSGSLYEGVDAFIDDWYAERQMRRQADRPLKWQADRTPKRSEDKPEELSVLREKCLYEAKRPEPAAPFESSASLEPSAPSELSEPCALEPAAVCLAKPGPDLEKGKHIQRQRSLEDVLSQLGETFQQRLLRLVDERGLSDVEVYKRANLDRKLFSKIRCNKNYKPKKKTALALAIALELNLDETRDLLGRAELALSPSSRFDLIVEYFIRMEVYDIYTINLALFAHEETLLGA